MSGDRRNERVDAECAGVMIVVAMSIQRKSLAFWVRSLAPRLTVHAYARSSSSA